MESDTQENIYKTFYDNYADDTFCTMVCTNECEPADDDYLKTILYNQSLVPYTALKKYVGLGFKKFYGWHISQLVIYDELKSLSEFSVVDTEAVNNCAFRNRVLKIFTLMMIRAFIRYEKSIFRMSIVRLEYTILTCLKTIVIINYIELSR